MSLVNKFARTFAAIAILSVTVWVVGCAGNEEDEDNGGENGNGAPAQQADPAGAGSETQ